MKSTTLGIKPMPVTSGEVQLHGVAWTTPLQRNVAAAACRHRVRFDPPGNRTTPDLPPQ